MTPSTDVRSFSLGRNFLGAFADAAILFPLLGSLSKASGFNGSILLATAGLAYIAAGLVFRVPMSVQPLKSIAIAALAVGATSMEVRVSGLLLGLFCLAMTFFDVDRWGARVPRVLIHGLQLGLGLLLVSQGYKAASAASGPQITIALALALTVAMLLIPKRIDLPALGLVATGGLIWGLFRMKALPAPTSASFESLRVPLIASLTLPQMVLTLGNSVLGTHDVAHRYFGERASVRVTLRRLLLSIGFGNVVMAAVGGLPYCHGSGGVTAHFKGGANHWISNLIIGTALIVLAAAQVLRGGFVLNYPPTLLAALLTSTGLLHMTLARASWQSPVMKAQLIFMGVLALLTSNMLWVLIGGAVVSVATEVLEPA